MAATSARTARRRRFIRFRNGELRDCRIRREALRGRLNDRGYKVVKTPLAAFLRSGGSACCLTLRLDHRSAAVQAVPALKVKAARGR